MSVLLDLGKKLTEYQNIKTAVAQGLSPISVYGVSPVHKAHLAAMLLSDLPCPFLYIVKDEEYAKKICADISELSGTEPVFLPGRDFVFYNVENVSKEYEQKSTKALWDILSSERPVVLLYSASHSQKKRILDKNRTGILHTGACRHTYRNGI